MKRISLLIITLLISLCTYSDDTVKNCRDYYYNVCLNETSVEDFNAYLKLQRDHENVVIKGYQSVIWFLKADYYINPFQKWKFFKKGKESLDFLIKKNPNNTELRFLRLTVQENIPKFLSYNNISKDRKFLNDQLKMISDQDLHSRISTYLKNTKPS